MLSLLNSTFVARWLPVSFRMHTLIQYTKNSATELKSIDALSYCARIECCSLSISFSYHHHHQQQQQYNRKHRSDEMKSCTVVDTLDNLHEFYSAAARVHTGWHYWTVSTMSSLIVRLGPPPSSSPSSYSYKTCAAMSWLNWQPQLPVKKHVMQLSMNYHAFVCTVHVTD